MSDLNSNAPTGIQPMVKTFPHTLQITASTPMWRGLLDWLEARHYEFQEVTQQDV